MSKGAPQVIAALCEHDPPAATAVAGVVDRFATHGYRSLAVAQTDSAGVWRVGGACLAWPTRRGSTRLKLSPQQGNSEST